LQTNHFHSQQLTSLCHTLRLFATNTTPLLASFFDGGQARSPQERHVFVCGHDLFPSPRTVALLLHLPHHVVKHGSAKSKILVLSMQLRIQRKLVGNTVPTNAVLPAHILLRKITLIPENSNHKNTTECLKTAHNRQRFFCLQYEGDVGCHVELGPSLHIGNIEQRRNNRRLLQAAANVEQHRHNVANLMPQKSRALLVAQTKEGHKTGLCFLTLILA
jgi:hypothetical protein